MHDFKIDGVSILGTEAFHDFDKRGFDDLSQGDSFGDCKDFSSTKVDTMIGWVWLVEQALLLTLAKCKLTRCAQTRTLGG